MISSIVYFCSIDSPKNECRFCCGRKFFSNRSFRLITVFNFDENEETFLLLIRWINIFLFSFAHALLLIFFFPAIESVQFWGQKISRWRPNELLSSCDWPDVIKRLLILGATNYEHRTKTNTTTMSLNQFLDFGLIWNFFAFLFYLPRDDVQNCWPENIFSVKYPLNCRHWLFLLLLPLCQRENSLHFIWYWLANRNEEMVYSLII